MSDLVNQRQTEGSSDQVSSKRRVRLFRGGHRPPVQRGKHHSPNDNALIIYAVRFVQFAPVGGAHL